MQRATRQISKKEEHKNISGVYIFSLLIQGYIQYMCDIVRLFNLFWYIFLKDQRVPVIFGNPNAMKLPELINSNRRPIEMDCFAGSFFS